MDVVLPRPGAYVVAVSGGVDSMVLLDMLAREVQRNPINWRITVAHLDHGIREDSAEDRRLVQAVARQYGLPFVYHDAALGAKASEAQARRVRYEFLQKVVRASRADGLLTAHHQDDLLETAIINMSRGTGRKGLTSLQDSRTANRPLLGVPKVSLQAYAQSNGLLWREDSTNSDTKYLRNHIRHHVVPKLATDQKQQFLQILNKLSVINIELDKLIVNALHQQSKNGQIDRAWFNQLTHVVAREVLATWLREHDAREFTTKTLERLAVGAKTAQPGKRLDVQNGIALYITRDYLALKGADR